MSFQLQRPCATPACGPHKQSHQNFAGLQRNSHNHRRYNPRSSSTSCRATDTKSKPVIEQLESDEDKQQWTDALQQLEDLGMDEEVAEKSLKRAFGWSSQAYWWKEKVKEVPQSGEVKEKLDHLRTLGLSDEQLKEAVTHFPETVGLDLEQRMKPNIELMGKKFFIKGKMLPKTLARKPQALGYAVDCEGDCKGDCTRCWSHF